MTFRILAAAALTLGLGTAAMAQATNDSGGSNTPMTMPENALSPFFTEPFDGALVSDAIKQERWMAMSTDQQEAARAECDRFASNGMSDDDMTTASTEATSTYQASVGQLCDWIDTL